MTDLFERPAWVGIVMRFADGTVNAIEVDGSDLDGAVTYDVDTTAVSGWSRARPVQVIMQMTFSLRARAWKVWARGTDLAHEAPATAAIATIRPAVEGR